VAVWIGGWVWVCVGGYRCGLVGGREGGSVREGNSWVTYVVGPTCQVSPPSPLNACPPHEPVDVQLAPETSEPANL
jgi:hypothetical protein